MCSSQEQTHTPVLCAVCDNLGNQSTACESHLIVSNSYRFIEPRGTGLPFPKGMYQHLAVALSWFCHAVLQALSGTGRLQLDHSEASLPQFHVPIWPWELNTIVFFMALFSDGFEYFEQNLVAYSCILLIFKCYEHVWGVWILWLSYFPVEQLQQGPCFTKGEKASKFSNYQGNVALVYIIMKLLTKMLHFHQLKSYLFLMSC